MRFVCLPDWVSLQQSLGEVSLPPRDPAPRHQVDLISSALRLANSRAELRPLSEPVCQQLRPHLCSVGILIFPAGRAGSGQVEAGQSLQQAGAESYFQSTIFRYFAEIFPPVVSLHSIEVATATPRPPQQQRAVSLVDKTGTSREREKTNIVWIFCSVKLRCFSISYVVFPLARLNGNPG